MSLTIEIAAGIVMAVVILVCLIQGIYWLTGPHYIDQSYLNEMAKCAALTHQHCS